MLSDQEKQFDIMFAAWEQGFDSWKRENQNNPDQVIQYNLQIVIFEVKETKSCLPNIILIVKYLMFSELCSSAYPKNE